MVDPLYLSDLGIMIIFFMLLNLAVKSGIMALTAASFPRFMLPGFSRFGRNIPLPKYCIPLSGQAALFHSNRNAQSPICCASKQNITSCFVAGIVRNFSYGEDRENRPRRRLPRLMDFPELVWPSLLKSMKNWILVHFIIRPYFDRDFTIPDFVAGTKHALQVVSAKIAEGDLSTLSGLVAADAINELKTSISKLSMKQRTDLRINKDDIFLSFPYQIGIMFDESNEATQKRWVEITMVFHVLRGLRELQDKGTPPPLNLGALPEYQDKVSICNYRFIKEFTQGNESDWTVNIVNHFKPSDFLDK